jgi:hypothetical protein
MHVLNLMNCDFSFTSFPQEVITTAVAMMMVAMGRAQIQHFGSFGAYPADSQQQQQLYQSAGVPVQGLRLQLSNPAGVNILQAIPQGTPRLISGSALGQK